MKKKWVSGVALLISVFMSVALFFPAGRSVKAVSTSASITFDASYSYFPFDGSQSGGTPFAYHIKFTGGHPNADYYYKGYFYAGSSNGAFVWKGSTSEWINESTSTTNLPEFTTDANGNWSGWIFLKTDSGKSFSGTVKFRIRCYLASHTSTKTTGTLSTVHFMDMDGSHSGESYVDTQGGWIEGHAYDTNGNPVSDYIVVVKDSNGHIVNAYSTEDNGITDGYGTDTGYYKVAVPEGSDYSVELWDPSNNSIVGSATTGVNVTAHQTTSNVDINAGSSPSLQVTTNSATNVTSSSATLNGTLNDLGSDTSATVYFEYGTDTSYGSETTHQTMNSTGNFTADISGLSPNTTYHYRAVATNSAGTSYGEDKTFVTLSSSAKVVLFDDTKDETAGNADWVIDGAYSDWADALRNEGYVVESLDSGPITSSALSDVDVFVIPEPQDEFSNGEITAIKNFVNNGGGLILIADHSGSDRNNNGHDSPHIYNNNFNVSDFGFKFNLDNFSQHPINNVNHTVYPALTDGVSSIGEWGASTVNITDGNKAKGVIFSNDNSKTIVVGAEYGSGRVAAIGDSSPFDDGSGHPGNHLYDGWDEYDDSTLGIDMVNWCAKLTSSPSVSTSSATNITSTSATLNGNLTDTGNASSVTVYFEYGTDTNYGSETTHQTMNSTGSFTADISGLSPNTTYHYRAVATNSAGTSYGDDKTFVTSVQIQPPSPPSNLTATANSSSITLNWDAPSDNGGASITSYKIYRGTSSGGESSTPIATVNGNITTYTDSNVTAGTTYYYKVTAVNSAGESAMSNEASATVMAIIPISEARNKPDGTEVLVKGTVTVPLGIFSSKYFYIEDSSGGIEIYRGSGFGTMSFPLNESITLKGKVLTYHNVKEIVISSLSDITDNGSASQVNPVQTDVDEVSSNYGKLIKIKGTVSDKTNSGFYVNDQNGNKVKVYVKSSTHISISGISDGEQVEVSGIAEPYHNSPEVMPRFQSDIVVLSVNPPSAPGHLTAVANNATKSVKLQWDASNPGTFPIAGYAIYRGTASGAEGNIPITTVDATTTEYMDAYLNPGTYYYVVKAFDNQNPPHYSAPSNEASTTVINTSSNGSSGTVPNTPMDNTPPTVNVININVNATEITNKGVETVVFIESDNSGNISQTVVKDNGMILKKVNGPVSRLDLPLREGINDIEIIVYDPSGNYTVKKFRVISDTKAPIVEVNLNKGSSANEVMLKGKIVDITTGVKSVSVNGKEVGLNTDGTLDYNLTLSPGKNIIEIRVTDRAGNVTTKTFTVTYTPSKNVSTAMIQLQIGNPFIEVNGTKKPIDEHGSKPIIRNNRTLLPIRVIIESLGGTISWNPKTREVTIKLNGHTIILTIGKNTAIVDGIKTPIDPDNPNVVPIIINGRTYIPLRFIAEHLNCTIDWDPMTKTVTIYYFG